MREKTKKATFNLHTNVLDALDEAMEQGMASSKNVLVENALIKELGELRRKARQLQWQEGAKDPLLIKDISAVESDFYSADSETAGRID